MRSLSLGVALALLLGPSQAWSGKLSFLTRPLAKKIASRTAARTVTKAATRTTATRSVSLSKRLFNWALPVRRVKTRVVPSWTLLGKSTPRAGGAAAVTNIRRARKMATESIGSMGTVGHVNHARFLTRKSGTATVTRLGKGSAAKVQVALRDSSGKLVGTRSVVASGLDDAALVTDANKALAGFGSSGGVLGTGTNTLTGVRHASFAAQRRGLGRQVLTGGKVNVGFYQPDRAGSGFLMQHTVRTFEKAEILSGVVGTVGFWGVAGASALWMSGQGDDDEEAGSAGQPATPADPPAMGVGGGSPVDAVPAVETVQGAADGGAVQEDLVEGFSGLEGPAGP